LVLPDQAGSRYTEEKATGDATELAPRLPIFATDQRFSL
jgi:hypothetical protein